MFCNPRVRSNSNPNEKRDRENATFILQTYCQTGRIILIPNLSKEFIDFKAYPTRFDERLPSLNLGNNFRPACSASLSYWTAQNKSSIKNLWRENLPHWLQTIYTIKTLLFLQLYRPDISDVTFLMDLQYVQFIADAYDLEGDLNGALKLLQQLKSVNIEHIKLEIKTKLLTYIESRGMIEGTQFVPNRSSSIFRDAEITKFRVHLALGLIKNIKDKNKISEVEQQISEAKDYSEEQFPCRFFKKSNFSQCMDACLQLISQNNELIHTSPNPSPTSILGS
jgi:hypothetical protein